MSLLLEAHAHLMNSLSRLIDVGIFFLSFLSPEVAYRTPAFLIDARMGRVRLVDRASRLCFLCFLTSHSCIPSSFPLPFPYTHITACTFESNFDQDFF